MNKTSSSDNKINVPQTNNRANTSDFPVSAGLIKGRKLTQATAKSHDLFALIQRIVAWFKSLFDPFRQPPIDTSIDKNRLMKGIKGDAEIKPHNRDWFLHHAGWLGEKHEDPNIQKRLELSSFQGYSKVASQEEWRTDKQTSPLFPGGMRYYRTSPSIAKLQMGVEKDFAKKIGLPANEVKLIDNPFLSEVFAREMPLPNGINHRVDAPEAFEKLVDRLFEWAKSGQEPAKFFSIDFTDLLKQNSLNEVPSIIQNFETIFDKRLVEFVKSNPNIDKKNIARLKDHLQFIAFSKFDRENFLIAPKFANKGSHRAFMEEIESLLNRSGFRVSPDRLKKAWLKVKDYNELLKSQKVPNSKLATRGSHIPTVCKTITELLKQPGVQKFKSLSEDPAAPPYLKIYPEATYRLLAGLEELDLDKKLADFHLTDQLQISYFRILNAISGAAFQKENPTQFLNEIELIHQEILTILSILKPYSHETLENVVAEKLVQGDSPVIPKELEKPHVHLKASAMHSLMSSIASVEAQKGGNTLNTVLLKDCYFETDDAVGKFKTHNLSVLDGDGFQRNPDISASFESVPNKPIDLFIGEFHHNLSINRHDYRQENILGMVKQLVEKGMTAEKFTVILDTTLNYEKSDDIRSFLHDKTIQDLIQAGKLNVVLLRSAVKFDLFGLDNFYGGISTVINNGEAFKSFNQRMDHRDDQLKGLSYQGITHIQKHSGELLDLYRKGIVDNTHRLYEQLPDNAIYHENTNNPLQISKNEDPFQVFLDIKFPDSPKTAKATIECFKKFKRVHHLKNENRPSFGYPVTNFMVIENVKFRVTPGLENGQTIDLFAKFFQQLQTQIDLINKENLTPAEIDEKVSKHLSKIKFSKAGPK